MNNCFVECALGIGECNQCVAINCLPDWQILTGVIDADVDGFTVLSAM